jgi:hypothetical protein
VDVALASCVPAPFDGSGAHSFPNPPRDFATRRGVGASSSTRSRTIVKPFEIDELDIPPISRRRSKIAREGWAKEQEFGCCCSLAESVPDLLQTMQVPLRDRFARLRLADCADRAVGGGVGIIGRDDDIELPFGSIGHHDGRRAYVLGRPSDGLRRGKVGCPVSGHAFEAGADAQRIEGRTDLRP